MEAKPSASTKNNDCYYYYYSTCSKGANCAFRHEPAALRNETMCIYWFQGSCTKPNCIFRHMEVVKKRDKIQCYFETQPGGCKKPHCPFLHQNILDHPREEDIAKKPDLILPVKNPEEIVGKKEPDERQVVLPGVHRGPKAAEVEAPSPQPVAPQKSPFIVPLMDGESDSESVTGSPYKVSKHKKTLSAEVQWELERLRQIQAAEAKVIGYSFEDDEVETQEEVAFSEADTLVEEVIEVEDDDMVDVAHRRFSPAPRDDLRARLGTQPLNRWLGHCKNSEEEVEVKEKASAIRRIEDRRVQSHDRLPVAKRLGGVAQRALSETLKSQVGKAELKRIMGNAKDNLENEEVRPLSERLGRRIQVRGKKSLAERLGRKRGAELLGDSSEEKSPVKVNSSLASRLGGKIQPGSKNENKDVNSFPKRLSNTRAQKQKGDSKRDGEFGFSIKTLSEIKAEKEKTVSRSDQKTKKKQADSTQLSNSKEDRLIGVKIKSLADIRAEKKKKESQTSINNTSNDKKRSFSPISFDEKKKMPKVEAKPEDTEVKRKEPTQQKVELSLGTRKLSLRKSPSTKEVVKSKNTKDSNQNNGENKPAGEVGKKSEKAIENNVTPIISSPKEVAKPLVRNLEPVKTEEQEVVTSAHVPPSVIRLDSLIDEEEHLLLQDDTDLDYLDEDINEDVLLM